MKIVWIAVICGLLTSACGTAPQSQIKPTGGATLAELEKAKASQTSQAHEIPEAQMQQEQQQQQQSPPQPPVPIVTSTPPPPTTIITNQSSQPIPNKPVAAKNPAESVTKAMSTPKSVSQSVAESVPQSVTQSVPQSVIQSVPAQQPTSPANGARKRSNQLSWNEFFDNELQNTPSQKFWDLQGQQVVIDGFMGEVLSFDGGWFLLIPAPGAECPFDNGDETYWNKIMIVFVKEKEGLRFTGGPLRITGRLDVGIKVDESNYKTMFRLYDAAFEESK